MKAVLCYRERLLMGECRQVTILPAMSPGYKQMEAVSLFRLYLFLVKKENLKEREDAPSEVLYHD